MSAPAAEAPTPVLEKGTVVIISGLQSEAGKKLNGGHGIVLKHNNSNKAHTADGDVIRYPVLVFAVLEGSGAEEGHKGAHTQSFTGENGEDYTAVFLQPTLNKKIKAENLLVMPVEQAKCVMRPAVTLSVMAAQKSGDFQGFGFWMETAHTVDPDDYKHGVTYANYLRVQAHKPKLSYQVLLKFRERALAGEFDQDPNFPGMCHDFCHCFCEVKERVDDALTFALKVPTDTPLNRELSQECLSILIRTCNQALSEGFGCNIVDMTRKQVATVLIRAATVQQEREDDNALWMRELGAAYCLADQPIHGVKWYRRTMEMPGPPSAMHGLKQTIISTQLQCPGMPLEDYKVFSIDFNRNTARCIKSSDIHKVKFGSLGGAPTVQATSHEGAEIIEYPLPSNPDDPEHFAASFLAQFSI